MAKISISIDDQLIEDVDSRLTYGDSRSAWIQDACSLKLSIVEELDELDEDWTAEERREFVVDAIRDARGGSE